MATKIISARPDGRIRRYITNKSTHQKINEIKKQLGIKETVKGVVVHVAPVPQVRAGVFYKPFND